MSLVTDSPLVVQWPLGVYDANRTADKHGLPDRLTPYAAPALIHGTLVDNLPITENAFSKSGNVMPSYVGDFYNRIHIIPAVVDAGNILNDSSYDIEVFNAYLASTRTLNDIITSGITTGLVLNQPVVTPTVFNKLESRIYQLDINTNGPPSIAAIYTFDFDTEDPTLTITGTRLIMFSFEPDWSDPVLETLEWRTNIIESESGLEQRIQTRQHPRKTLEYRVLVSDNDKRLLETYLWGWRNRIFGIPLWNECTVLGGTLSFGATIVSMDTNYKQFIDGGIAIFIDDAFNYEAVTIDTVTPTQLNLLTPTTRTWGPTTRIYPVALARLLDTPSITQPTVNITYATFRFTFVDNEPLTATPFTDQYQTRTVLVDAPDRSDDLTISYESKIDALDYDVGIIDVLDRSGFPDQVNSGTWLFQDKERAWEWKEFFHFLRGRQKQFYIPSWSADFELLDDIDSTDTSFTVKDTQYRRFLNVDPAKRDIRILINDGTIYYRRIIGAAEGAPGEELISIDSQLGTSYTVDQVMRIEYLYPVRLNSDAIEIAWMTQDIVQIELATRVIEQ